MINHPQRFVWCLSILTLTSATPLNAHWDWKDVAAVGAIAAGVGACVYVATRPEDPHELKRKAEVAYQRISRDNRNILNAAQQRSEHALMTEVTRKGRTYHNNYTYADRHDYLTRDCKQFSPLLRGYAALINDSEELLDYRRRLISCFGSAHIARHEYCHFERLEVLAAQLQSLAHKLERHHAFLSARESYAAYRAQKEAQERLQRQLERTQYELEALRARSHEQRYYGEDCFCTDNRCHLRLNFYN
jgi:hypothetical protein